MQEAGDPVVYVQSDIRELTRLYRRVVDGVNEGGLGKGVL